MSHDEVSERQMVLSHMVELFGPIDSMLREVPTQTKVGYGATALAQPDHNEIVFSQTELAELAHKDVVHGKPLEHSALRLTAANYRAAAAADLNRGSSMRPFPEIHKWDAKVAQAFYAAETARLESQYAALYPGLTPAFTYEATVVLEEVLSSTPQRRQIPTTLASYAYVALRPYLGANLFNTMYELAQEVGADTGVLDELAVIGEEFVQLQWPQDADKGRLLATRLSDLVTFPDNMAPQVGQRSPNAKGNEELRKEAQQAVKDQIERQNEGEDENPNDQPEPGDGDGDQQGDQEGQGGGQEGAGDGEGQGEGDGTGQGQQSPQEAQNGAGEAKQQLQDQLKKLQAKAQRSSTAQQAKDMAQEAVIATGAGLDAAAFKHDKVTPSTTARVLRGQMTKVFSTLVEQLAGGVQYGTKRGPMVPIDRRMGKRRYRATVVPNRRNELSMDVAVLVDTSASMHGHETALGEALWAIKGGIDDAAQRHRGIAKSRVWEFNSTSHLLYFEGRPLSSTVMLKPQPNGGTNPLRSLEEAQAWLSKSKASNKMLVVLTDGAWGDPERSERIIQQLNANGDTATVLFYLSEGYYGPGDPHGCQHFIELKELAPMARHTRKIIDTAMRKKVGL